MRWTYSETDQEGTQQKVVVTVSDQTKKISNGVTARVVRDAATADGAITEDTFDWYDLAVALAPCKLPKVGCSANPGSIYGRKTR